MPRYRAIYAPAYATNGRGANFSVWTRRDTAPPGGIGLPRVDYTWLVWAAGVDNSDNMLVLETAVAFCGLAYCYSAFEDPDSVKAKALALLLAVG